MSDQTQNPQTEEITGEVVEATAVFQETPEAPMTESRGSSDRPRGRDGGRPQGRGDRRGSRRDGMREEEKEFKEEMLAVDRVTRVTAGGRQIRFRASVVIGDGKGRIGLGTGKSGEVQSAVEKAIRDAKKNLITFPMINGTIPHDVFVEFKSSSVYLHPAHPGTGIIAGGAIRKIFAVSGIRDIIAKQHGAPNMITNARVALKALKALKPTSMNRSFGTKKSIEGTEEIISEKKTPEKSETAEKKSAPTKNASVKKAPAKKKAE